MSGLQRCGRGTDFACGGRDHAYRLEDKAGHHHHMPYCFISCTKAVAVLRPRSIVPVHRFLTKLGYAISLYSFKGPFLPELDIRAGQVLSLGWNTIVNLFCVRQVREAGERLCCYCTSRRFSAHCCVAAVV